MSEAPLTLSSLGQPLVTARSAEIYAWPQQRILKLFYPAVPADEARRERVNASEAHALGATQVRCFDEVEVEGRYGIVMSRLEGGTLTKSTDANPLNLLRIPVTLARLQAQMHSAQTTQLQDVRQVIAGFLDHPALGFLTAAERVKARHHILQLPDGQALLHMDFHTDNILVCGQEATVIDWATAARGDAGADLAMTCFLFNEAELFPGITPFQAWLYNVLRKGIYRAYARRYRALRGLSREAFGATIARWYLSALIFRLASWQASTEVQPLQAKIRTGIARLPEVQP